MRTRRSKRERETLEGDWYRERDRYRNRQTERETGMMIDRQGIRQEMKEMGIEILRQVETETLGRGVVYIERDRYGNRQERDTHRDR